MQLDVKIDGLDRINKASESVRMMVAKELVAALHDCGEKVRGDAIKDIMQGTKSGKVYKVGNVLRQSSKEGESPANQTGRLVGSIQTYKEDEKTQVIVAGKGLVKYASFLEFGTSKMGARPFLFPALEKSKRWIIERLNKSVRDAAIKSVGK